MNTTNILDMTASLAFQSTSSMSFSLSRQSESLCPARQLGWIDIHFPCEGHIKAQIRVVIPKEYHMPVKMAAITKAVMVIAGIPEDETYEATFVDAAAITVLSQPTNRQGITNRI